MAKNVYWVDTKDKHDSKWVSKLEFNDFFEALNKAVEISKTYKPLWIAVKVRVYDFTDDKVVVMIDRPFDAQREAIEQVNGRVFP